MSSLRSRLFTWSGLIDVVALRHLCFAIPLGSSAQNIIAALSQPDAGVKMEGINYFADTLLFAGVIPALASATRRSETIPRF